MKLELISFARCPFVHRAAIMLNEKNVQFSIRYIDLQNKPPWFLDISPRGKVPVLLYGDTPIFESSAINELLDETNPPRIMPEDPVERARQRGWVEVANDLFSTQYDFTAAKTEDEFAKAKQKLHAVFERFEETIREPFFAGDKFGWVDIAAAPGLYRQTLLKSVFDDLPKTKRWAERVAVRPSVLLGVSPEFEKDYLDRIKKRGSIVAAQL